jgi:hypothetical protein
LLSTIYTHNDFGKKGEQSMMEHKDCLDGIKERLHTVIMATDSFALLRYRRKEIAAEVHDLRVKLQALEREDGELASAERILARFGPAPDEAETASVPGDGKPTNIPTTPSMIIALLREAAGQGKPGLEPREMQISISKRWWPTVKSEDVGPTAWRMWKEGRLAKSGSLYMLKNTAAADLLGEDPATAD